MGQSGGRAQAGLVQDEGVVGHGGGDELSVLFVLHPGVLGHVGVGVAVLAADDDFAVGPGETSALVGVIGYEYLFQLGFGFQGFDTFLLNVTEMLTISDKFF